MTKIRGNKRDLLTIRISAKILRTVLVDYNSIVITLTFSKEYSRRMYRTWGRETGL